MDYTLHLPSGELHIERPIVMGILNATPDSFFAASRMQTLEAVARRAEQIIGEGGSIIDVGAVSTRPGAEAVSESEERRRLSLALAEVRRVAPAAAVSVDTYRPTVARMAVEEYGADIINDVSEGGVTAAEGVPYSEAGGMFEEVARLRVPYVLMSVRPTTATTLWAFEEKVRRLRELGVRDIILDPGYGFGKTAEQSFQILARQRLIVNMYPSCPVLAGLSRKRVVWQTLGITASEALNGTTVLNTLALERGAAILRVHDVREASEAIILQQKSRF